MSSTSPHFAQKLLLALATLLAPAWAEDAAKEPNKPETPAPPTISAERMYAHLRFLASDELAGRASGSPEEKKVTEYLAAQFKEMGLASAGENGGFFQAVPLPADVSVKDGGVLGIVDDAELTLAQGTDFYPLSMSAAGDVTADAVLAGYGISAPDLGYDDYAGVDVKGKVVFVFRYLPSGTPAWSGPGPRRRYAPFTVKVKQAADRGAAALVVVNNSNHIPQHKDRLMRGNVGGGGATIPCLHMTLAMARKLFPKLFGATPEDLELDILSERPIAPRHKVGTAKVRVIANVTRTPRSGINVCAWLEAGQAKSHEDFLVVGAHHDHVGLGKFGSLGGQKARGQVHNGADDNASGTSALLEIAR
ncbi:MAG: M28 family peptidase, partial [Planctomycetota bacterium]